MTEHIKTPELRFSNFLDMWHIHKLSDVATITGGGTPSTKVSEYWDGEIDWYTPNEIGERIYARGSKKKITNLGYKKSSTKLLPINTILFTSRAGIGNTAILAKEGCTNQGFQSIIPNSEKIDSYFIYTISNHIKKYALKHAAGSTFLEISGKELGKMKLFLPSLKEQQKIGVFFSKLDRQIELEEEKLELLEQQKRGYMQKFFSQELRFKTKDNVYYSEWQLYKLGEIFKYSQGQQISVDKQFSVKNNGMKRFIRIVDITENPEPRFVLYESDTGLVNKGDLFMIRYGRPGIVSIGFEGIIANNLFKLIPKIKISTIYFYYLLSYNYYRINLLTNQSTMPALNFKSLDLLKFKIPSYKEQNKIANFLESIDKLVMKQSDKVKLLKQRKKGLLQKMFV
ncbi:restriction endonuclease subunit S [Staphylococcus hominis]|uniref:restriction endonuclease subunit S n=1 Tax=Staphylococcus hominis TaxID=1290 RepID=UPI001E318F72|nr:restriction endonuclease subunit S [Staphylococcus hominis]MCD8764440.1 restriction endonuclease subunit S [Staphylococcus hominis]